MGVLNLKGKGVDLSQGGAAYPEARGPEYPRSGGMHKLITVCNCLKYVFKEVMRLNTINELRQCVRVFLPLLVLATHHAFDQSLLVS